MKPHIKVIQRNGVDIFVTRKSQLRMKAVKLTKLSNFHLLEHFRLENEIIGIKNEM